MDISLQVRSRARHVMDTGTSIAASRRKHTITDQAQRRDPTNANDLRRRLQTELRLALQAWKQHAYDAIVRQDALGYALGDVAFVQDLTYNLNYMLQRQAFVTLAPAYDNLAINLRTAYSRGVNKAIVEMGEGRPFPVGNEVLEQAYRELQTILDSQLNIVLNRILEDPERAMKSRWLLWSSFLLPGLFKPMARRTNALATTNVTRAYNAGKLDTYEGQGETHVGVKAELQPAPRHRHERPGPDADLDLPELPEPVSPIYQLARLAAPAVATAIVVGARAAAARAAEPEPEPRPKPARMLEPRGREPRPATRMPASPGRHYTVQTMGDDKVCAICQNYEGRSFTLAQARRIIPAHPHCRCSVVLLT